jgi:hypothetical protein
VTKKERELRFLARLRDSCPDRLEGIICLQEEPDFVIKTQNGLLGVEIREWFYDEVTGKGGSPTRQQESLSLETVLKARDLYNSTGLPPINVNVDFHPLYPLSSKDTNRLAANIASIAQRHVPDQGIHVPIGWPEPNWKELPREVYSVYISRPRAGQEVLWAPEGGGAIPTLSPGDVERVLTHKERHLPRYRQSAGEIWLLLVAVGFNLSGFCKIDPELGRHVFSTEFDAVFFLHYSDDILMPLLVKGMAANPGLNRTDTALSHGPAG